MDKRKNGILTTRFIFYIIVIDNIRPNTKPKEATCASYSELRRHSKGFFATMSIGVTGMVALPAKDGHTWNIWFAENAETMRPFFGTMGPG